MWFPVQVVISLSSLNRVQEAKVKAAGEAVRAMCKTAIRGEAIKVVAAEASVGAEAVVTDTTKVMAAAAVIATPCMVKTSVKEDHLVETKVSIKTWAGKAAAVEVEWDKVAVAAKWEVECTVKVVMICSPEPLAEAVELVVEATKELRIRVIRAKTALVASRTTRPSCASTLIRVRLAHTPITALTPTACMSYARPIPTPKVGKWAAKACIKTRRTTSNS